jgi:hypothetical protein
MSDGATNGEEELPVSLEIANGLSVYLASWLAASGLVSRWTSLCSVRHGDAWAACSNFWRSALGKKLYVGNLSYSISSSDLEKLFASFGSVESAQVIADRESGRSKGFGFVEMGSDEEAQAAIRGLNGQDNDGRPLTVNEARPREERSGGGGGRGGYGGGGGGGYGGGGGGGGSRGGRGGGRY